MAGVQRPVQISQGVTPWVGRLSSHIVRHKSSERETNNSLICAYYHSGLPSEVGFTCIHVNSLAFSPLSLFRISAHGTRGATRVRVRVADPLFRFICFPAKYSATVCTVSQPRAVG